MVNVKVQYKYLGSTSNTPFLISWGYHSLYLDWFSILSMYHFVHTASSFNNKLVFSCLKRNKSKLPSPFAISQIISVTILPLGLIPRYNRSTDSVGQDRTLGGALSCSHPIKLTLIHICILLLSCSHPIKLTIIHICILLHREWIPRPYLGSRVDAMYWAPFGEFWRQAQTERLYRLSSVRLGMFMFLLSECWNLEFLKLGRQLILKLYHHLCILHLIAVQENRTVLAIASRGTLT